jgi:hypothetical protein
MRAGCATTRSGQTDAASSNAMTQAPAAPSLLTRGSIRPSGCSDLGLTPRSAAGASIASPGPLKRCWAASLTEVFHGLAAGEQDRGGGATPHSITSSARAKNERGIVRPSLLAVFMLMTSSNFVGCSTGKSAGFAPLSILSTNTAERLERSAKLAP